MTMNILILSKFLKMAKERNKVFQGYRTRVGSSGRGARLKQSQGESEYVLGMTQAWVKLYSINHERILRLVKGLST